jgi:hypothetical protein
LLSDPKKMLRKGDREVNNGLREKGRDRSGEKRTADEGKI